MNSRRSRWSKILLVAGAVMFFFTALVGFVNAAVVNGANFAGILNDVRQDEEVKTEVGQVVSMAAVDAQPDLIAVQPAIAAGAAAVVGSPIIDGLFTSAVQSFHDALTEEGATGNAVLTLADLGATVTTALERFVPQAADVIPPDLNVTLAQVGGQEGIAAEIIPIVSFISTLAWVLPLVSLALIALGLWLAPRRRLATVALGWMLMIVGGFLGLIVLAMNVTGALMDDSTLPGALLSASLAEFSQPLAVRFIATVVVGGLLVVAAGAFLPQVDLAGYLRTAREVVTNRPTSPGWAVLRALLVILVGALIVLFPGISAQFVAVLVGLGVFFVGIAELDQVAERARARDEQERAAAAAAAGPEGRRRRPAASWLIPTGAAVAGVAVLGALIIPDHLPQEGDIQNASVNADACNGHVELCDRPFNEVAIAASHNSMSVADGEWYLAEQPKDMVESLDDGIRGLLVDTWYGQPTKEGGAITAAKSMAAAEAELTATYGAGVVASIQRTIDRVRRAKPSGPAEPYFCHTVCEIGATPMQPTMERLNTWLEEHPREVIVLFIQDMVTPADTAAVLEEAGLADKAYVHPAGADWPTLRQMIDSDKRLLVLMENTGGGPEFPYLHQGFDLVQDTEYTFDTAEDFTCTLKRGTPDSPLFGVNHWLASFKKLVSNAEEVNAYDVLKARVDQCRSERGMIPNLVAVNWYDRGEVFRVVDELNGVAG